MEEALPFQRSMETVGAMYTLRLGPLHLQLYRPDTCSSGRIRKWSNRFRSPQNAQRIRLCSSWMENLTHIGKRSGSIVVAIFLNHPVSSLNHAIIGNTLLVPVYVAALSLIVLISRSMLQGRQKGHTSRQLRIFEPEQETLDPTVDATSDTAWYRQRMRGVLKAHGSRLAYVYNALRSMICLALLAVSVYAVHIQSVDIIQIAPVVLYVSALQPQHTLRFADYSHRVPSSTHRSLASSPSWGILKAYQ